MATLSTNIQYLKGVGEKRARLYARLGIATIGDLLEHYPRDYIDFSHPVPSSALLMMNLAPFGPGSQPSQQSSAFGKGFPCSRY